MRATFYVLAVVYHDPLDLFSFHFRFSSPIVVSFEMNVLILCVYLRE